MVPNDKVLVLGLAALAQEYGFVDRRPPTQSEAWSLLNLAANLGIKRFDTAPGYRADTLLSQWASAPSMMRNANQFQVSIKVPMNTSLSPGQELRRAIDRIAPLQITSCLIHDWPEVKAPLSPQMQSHLNELRGLREGGVISELGISIYEDVDLEIASRHFQDVDVVQLPMSVVDQRLVKSVHLEKLRLKGTAVEARSILLQGMIVASKSKLAAHPPMHRVTTLMRNHGLTPLQAAVSFIKNCSLVDRVIVGSKTEIEFRQITSAWQQPIPNVEWSEFALNDDALLDPRKWVRQ